MSNVVYKSYEYYLANQKRALARVSCGTFNTENDSRIIALLIERSLMAYGQDWRLYLLDRKLDNRYAIEIDATGRVLR